MKVKFIEEQMLKKLFSGEKLGQKYLILQLNLIFKFRLKEL